MTKILVIDDDPRICLFFASLLKDLGYSCETAHTLGQGRDLSLACSFDLVFLDLELPDGNGLDLLPELNQSPLGPEVIIITGTGDVRGAELAFKYGAWDYVQKPFLLEEVTLPIKRAMEYRKEKKADLRPTPLVRKAIVGDSAPIRKCLEDVARASTTDLSVLISGETGTGKELFAKAIHENSKRADQPFIAVDCGALPETLVESTLFGHEKGAFTGAGKKQAGLILQANKGTLMLDEVGDLPLAAQKSLLRTLQERYLRPIGGTKEIPVDIRLIAATNLDLDSMVQEQLFRADLLYRIRAMEINLPPLRRRGTDIEEIVLKKVHELSNRYQTGAKAVSPEFLTALMNHRWPGNVRELINVLEYALASAGADPTLFPKHLPPENRLHSLGFGPDQSPGVQDGTGPDPAAELPTLNEFRRQSEKKYLNELMARAGGNRKKACQISGISQSRLYGLLSAHNLSGFSNS